jgi:hypothetical protein
MTSDHVRGRLTPRLPQVLGSGVSVRRRSLFVGMYGWLERLSETGAESAIIDGAADLKEQVSAAS